MRRFFLLLTFILAIGCGTEKVSRNHFPIIKANLYKLQVAVKEKNLAQIDSLLSVKILDKKQSSDSLIKFVYGVDGSFQFRQFGNAEIIHSNNQARIDCYVMDSTGSTERPMVFFLTVEHEMWLFSAFDEKKESDSLRFE